MKRRILLLLQIICAVSPTWSQNFWAGVGIADVTGPAAGINMMGYADPTQTTHGIHLRLHSRAFIFANEDGTNPVVFVSVDIAMTTQIIKREVMARLADLYGDRYIDENVMLSSTHTHSGPAAFHQYFLYEVTSLGFFEQSLDAIVDGIVLSIELAHENLQPADLLLNSGILTDANINRSPIAYENNPEEEKARYNANVDQEMVLVKIQGSDGQDMGMVNWFPVHPVSMNRSNELISSDNKGYASLLFEGDFNDGLPGKGPYVAAFAQANLGDVSPNTKGPKCIDTGEPCDELTNACSDGKVQNCIAFGPGDDMFESTKIIGDRQYQKAKELYNNADRVLSGKVAHRLKYVNMTNQEIVFNSTYTTTTCKPALGYSFAAGTSDGTGAFNFTQGDLTGDPFWDWVRDLLKEPTEELIECHQPKPILVPTGEMTTPYMWQPEILDYQIFSVGQLVIVGVPGEYSTMAGRRVKEMVYKVLTENGYPEDITVVLAGLSNSYSSYIVTYEEYLIQRYEGAFTIYGPHTLQAAMNNIEDLAVAMAMDTPVDKGTPPPNLKDEQVSLIPAHLFDSTPPGMDFGDVLNDVDPTYNQGDRASVTFVAGSPRNDLQLEKTFLTVESLQEDEQWEVIQTDSNWDTRFYWEGEGLFGGQSNATITWDIPSDQPTGVYRIQHFGHSKNVLGVIQPYTGTSSNFQVNPSFGKMNSLLGRFSKLKQFFKLMV